MGSPALERLRAAGWTVGVHNDYRSGGEPMTFWLLTHPSGVWIKGEGATDEDALAYVEEQAGRRVAIERSRAEVNELLAAARATIAKHESMREAALTHLATYLGHMAMSSMTGAGESLNAMRRCLTMKIEGGPP